MNHVWWRTHLRRLPELGFLAQFGNFAEVDRLMPFLSEALDCPSGGRVLELGCGRGSFSIRLAQWGYQVTGIDESEPMLEVARSTAARHEAEVDFQCADPREIPERSAFDAALMLDFGTRSDLDNAAMMRAVAASLKPGGRLAFGMCNPYYWCREGQTEHSSAEGMDIVQRYQFDFTTGSMVSRVRCILRDGQRKDLPAARYRAYTLPELRALAEATGLADLRVHGQDEGGAPRTDRPPDMLRTPVLHCVAIRPVHGESGEGI